MRRGGGGGGGGDESKPIIGHIATIKIILSEQMVHFGLKIYSYVQS